MPKPLEIGDKYSSLFYGLSGFWQRFFRDTPDLQAYYNASEYMLGEVYLDLLSNVLGVSISDVPIFDKGYWKLFVIGENDLNFEEGASVEEDRYAYDMPGDTVEVDFLQNTIFEPTITFERDVEFDLKDEDGLLRFKLDPFRELLDDEGNWYPAPGISWRLATIEVGNQFTDVVRTLDWRENSLVKSGDTLRLLAYNDSTWVPVQEGSAGEFLYPGSLIFTDVSAVFNETHVGDIIQVTESPSDDVVGYYIVKSFDPSYPDKVYLEEAYGVPLVATSADLRWKHTKAVYYESFVQDYAVNHIEDTYLVGDSDKPYPIDENFTYVYAVVRDLAEPEEVGVQINNYPNVTDSLGRHIIPGTMDVRALRIDKRNVVEGVDFTVDYLRGKIIPTLYPATGSMSGTDGTITAGTVAQFSSPTTLFSAFDVGSSINITTSINVENTGIFVISAVISPTIVELADSNEMVSETPVAWTIYRSENAPYWDGASSVRVCSYSRMREVLFTAGGKTSERYSSRIKQISLWAPEVSIDNFTLYYNFGSLLNRFEASSEAYREFLRGIMYLYMSGPILQRTNSALNVVAGFPVIHTDGEVLAAYEDGVDATGTDGIIAAGDPSTLTSASMTFTELDIGGYVTFPEVVNDANRGAFLIDSIIDEHTVALRSTYSLVNESFTSWILSRYNVKKVTTTTPSGDTTVYSYPFHVPMRADLSDSKNIGVLTFSAFEYLTDAFQVLDYLEESHWWHNKYIPEILWANTTAARRLAADTLYANIISPADDARIGDPGFFIGADDNGEVYEPTDGVGNPVDIHRHTAAFCLFDRYLKFHMTYISWSADLQLDAQFTEDLNEIILITKPAYTYPYVEPSDDFEDELELWDTLSIDVTT
jgi:hypothetical protein